MQSTRVALVTGSLVTLLVACVGGPGPLPDQGPDQGSQGGGITGDTSASEGSGGRTGDSTDDASPAPPAIITVTNYDTTCSEDSDCVAVYQGVVCQACLCPNAAVNRKDLENYSKDLEKAGTDCSRDDVACGPCETQMAGCDAKTKRCALGVTSADEG